MPTRPLLVAALLVAAASPARAGDPSLTWKTVETEHFVVTYYEPLGDVARRVAVVAERAHKVLAPAFGHHPREKTHIVITDETDGSNGFANVLPRNSIRLFASAPVGHSALNDHDDWLYGLTAHEYTHVLHLDSIGGLPNLYNRVVGKTWSPNQIQPRWVIEGLATYEESRRSSSGRVRHALFDAELRVATLAGKMHDIAEVSHGPQEWPHGNVAYLHGSHFLDYVFDRHGDDAVRKLTWDYGSNPAPWGINQSMERVTGHRFVDLYDDWLRFLRAKYALELEAIERRGRREGRRLTFGGEDTGSPAYSKDGRSLLYDQADGMVRQAIYRMPVGANVGRAAEYARISRAGEYDVLADGSLVVDVTRHYRSEYSWSDIYRWDAGSKRLERLTRGVRGRDPAASPDEKWVAFSMNGGARRQLAIIPMQVDAQPQVIWSGERFDQASQPAWSPDGGRIAFVAWRAGGYRDILVWDRASGAITEITHDRAQDNDPVWDPGGRWLYYASDRSGVYNIYAHELATGRTRQVTNVVGCALAPAVSPDGKRLAYQGFDVGGFDLWEIDLDERDWLEPLPYVDDRPAPTRIRDDEVTVTAPRPYRPLETLAPQSYRIELASNSFGQTATFRTGGSDVAGHHGYSFGVTAGLDDPRLSAGISYGYSRLWPDLRLAVARDASERGGLLIDGINTRFTEERIGATAGLSLPVLRTTDGEGSLQLDYDFDYLANVEDAYEGPDPNDSLPRFPQTDVIFSAVALRFRYSDTRRYVHRLGVQEGVSLGGTVRLNLPELGSDLRTLQIDWSAETFRKLPWGVTPTLAVRLTGGIRSTDVGRGVVFGLGGVPEQNIAQSILDSVRAARSGFLRGFPSQEFVGNQYHLLNLEYRHELAEIEKGLQTLPIYVRRLHFAGLVDVGDAFTDGFEPRNLNLGVGAVLRLDMVFGYFVPGALDIGYARGLTEGGINEWWMLLTGEI